MRTIFKLTAIALKWLWDTIVRKKPRSSGSVEMPAGADGIIVSIILGLVALVVLAASAIGWGIWYLIK